MNRKDEQAQGSELSEVAGRRCILLDPRAGGQIGTALELRPSGMRIFGVGIVPHGEYRLAAEDECADWDAR